ncbi:MAG: hypothetical protein WDM79_12715 [Terricaulis sp.]
MLTGEDGRNLPEIRRVARGESASGSDWIGLRRNGAYTVRAAAATPLGPSWAWAVFGVALLMLGWRREAVCDAPERQLGLVRRRLPHVSVHGGVERTSDGGHRTSRFTDTYARADVPSASASSAGSSS